MNAHRPLVLVLLIGCAPVEKTTLNVRDPHAVSLEVSGDDGAQTVVAADGEAGEARLPPRREAWKVSAVRDGAGGIALRCDRCIGAPQTQIVWGDGHVVTLGAPESAVTRDGDLVHVRVAYDERSLATSHLDMVRPHRAEALLTTPASNVVDVKGTKTGYTTAGLVLIGAGLLVGAVGATAMKARDGADPAQRGLLLGTGVTGLVLGAGLGLGGTALVLTPGARRESM